MWGRYDGSPVQDINTCCNDSAFWQNDLSPFKLGPLKLYGEFEARTMENAWQYAKVYSEHVDSNGEPTDKYWDFARKGWLNPRAVRYPMGKGARPLYSLWQNEKLGYVDARKRIYAPLYANLVIKTKGYAKLKNLFETEEQIILRDFDGYDHDSKGMSLTSVLNHQGLKMGHAFVLKMLLTNDSALSQCGIDSRYI